MDSRLGAQLKELVEALNNARIPFALIGGLALASYKIIRATRDIELLVDIDEGEKLDTLLHSTGYECLQRSEDAANYQRGNERVDVLYARRPIARQLLETATDQQTTFGTLRIVSAEGLIGFKLQAISNDPLRTQDLEDIRALLRENRGSLDMSHVREYFHLFEQEPLLEKLVSDIN